MLVSTYKIACITSFCAKIYGQNEVREKLKN